MMKKLMWHITLALGLIAGGVHAEQTVRVDGEDYLLSDLTKNCQSITGDPAAQIACFTALSELVSGGAETEASNDEAVIAAFDTLRMAAQYQDDETGLLMTAEGCTIQIIAYGNYFHISRRNISAIDIYATTFDASQYQYDQTVMLQGTPMPMLRGTMAFGASASAQGGAALESGPGTFAPRAPGMPLGDFAQLVASKLLPNESQSFDFVLVHPQRSQTSGEIIAAFQAYVEACQG